MTMPEGAQLSPDGNYWWDGNEWQPVAGGGGQAAGGQSGYDSGQGDGGANAAAAFALGGHGIVAQLGVSDEADDPMPAADRDTKVSFTVVNMGTAAGVATVHIFVDDVEVQSSPWTSQSIEPGQSAQPDDAFFHHCGSYPAGSHTFKATVEPAATGQDDAVSVTNTVDLS
jgi:hypothetical protein